MTVTKRTLFIPQLLVLVTLVLLTLLDLNPQALVALLCAALMGLWIAGAFVEPFSLLLSALALAGTTSVLSLLHISGVPFSVNGLLVAGIGGACGLAVLLHHRHQFRTLAQLRRWLLESAPLSLLLMWALIRTPGAPSLSDAISDILIWGALLLVYVLARAYWVEHPDMLPVGTRAFLYVGFLTLGMIVVDSLLGNVFFNESDPRLTPGLHTTAGARTIPAFFGLALVPVLAYLRFEHAAPRTNRRLLAGLAVVLAMWVYFSLGRAALLGAAGVVIPLILFAPRALWKAVILVAVGVGLTAALIQSPLYPREKLGTIQDAISIEEEISASESGEEAPSRPRTRPRVTVNEGMLQGITFGRTAVWKYLVERAINEAPLTGFGTGAARDRSADIIPSWDNPHNDFIRVFFDQGAIGLLILVLSWAVLLLLCWQNWLRLGPGTHAAAYNFAALTAGGYILLNFLTDNFIVYFFIMAPFWLLTAMASAATVHVEVLEGTELPATGVQPIPVETPSRIAPEQNVQWDR